MDFGEVDSYEEGSWNSLEAFYKDQDEDELGDFVISREVRMQGYIINWFCSISNIDFEKFLEGSELIGKVEEIVELFEGNEESKQDL